MKKNEQLTKKVRLRAYFSIIREILLFKLGIILGLNKKNNKLVIQMTIVFFM